MAIDKTVGTNNPANDKPKLPKGYRPMSGGQRKLEVPELEGYRMYWFRDEPGRINDALRAGYEFVEKDEISLNDFDLAGDGTSDKGSDMGSRVSVSTGEGEGRLILMKCPLEIAAYAQTFADAQVDSVAEALRGGTVGQEKVSQKEKGLTYAKDIHAPLFNRKR